VFVQAFVEADLVGAVATGGADVCVMSRRVPSGLLRTQHLDRRRLGEADGPAVEAAALALSVERAVGGPVEIDVAWRRGDLHLLGVRPAVPSCGRRAA
jgi:hypothetical protein